MELVEPFLNALIEVFKKQLNIAILAGEVHPNFEFQEALDIVGVIKINSEKINGELALCFPKSCFLLIYNKLFSEKLTEISGDVSDSAGEFVNMVLGQAKADINKITGLTVDRTTPEVMTGNMVDIAKVTGPRTVTVPFALPQCMESQSFYMSLTIHE